MVRKQRLLVVVDAKTGRTYNMYSGNPVEVINKFKTSGFVCQQVAKGNVVCVHPRTQQRFVIVVV